MAAGDNHEFVNAYDIWRQNQDDKIYENRIDEGNDYNNQNKRESINAGIEKFNSRMF